MQAQSAQQEQPRLAPGMFEQGNIDLNSRPRVYNPDGSISTVRSMGANFDGREVLLPTVRKDPFHPFGGYIMSDDAAVAHYRNTGQHLGIFDTPQNADAYGRALHDAQALQYRK